MQAKMKSTRKRIGLPHNPLLEKKHARSEQFQELKKESLTLMDEMKTKHVQIFYNWINSKLQIMKTGGPMDNKNDEAWPTDMRCNRTMPTKY